MAQQESFGRNVKVRIYALQVVDITGSGQIFVEQSDQYTEFGSVQKDGTPGYRIRGKITQVEATISMGINPITFSIYNLGPQSRALFQSQVGTKIEILAGYGDNPKQIAVGSLLWSMTHKEGVDYITEVICGDSHFALVNGQMNTSFSGSVTYKRVIAEIVSNLNQLGIFAAGGNDKYIPDGSYNTGIVLSKGPLDELKDVCNKLNLSSVVSGNIITILPVGVDKGAPLIELSEDTGLIGIPQVRSPGVIGIIKPTVEVSPQNNLSFTTLLMPEIGMFQRVKITSKFVNGEYTCGRVVHDFDSWDGPFYTQCEASIGL